MKPEDHGLEDIISSLNSIREQLETGIQAASPDRAGDFKASDNPDEESGVTCLGGILGE